MNKREFNELMKIDRKYKNKNTEEDLNNYCNEKLKVYEKYKLEQEEKHQYEVRQSDSKALWFVVEIDTKSIVKVYWNEYQALEYIEKEERLVHLTKTIKNVSRGLKNTNKELF